MTSYDFRASNVGPLTTTFTAPSSCFQTTSFSSVDLYSTYFWIGYGPGVGLNYETESDACVPQLATPTPLVYNWYYSPGICPTGYILGGSLATGPQARTCTSVLPSSVTAWLCCPTGYTPSVYLDCGWQNTAICTSTAVGTETLKDVMPWIATGDMIGATPSPEGFVVQTIITEAVLTVNAMGLPIMWESTDTAVESWFSAAPKEKFIPTTTPEIAPYYTDPIMPEYTSSHSSPSGSGSSMPTGSLVGLICAVTGVVLVIVGYSLSLWAKGRPQKRAQGLEEQIRDFEMQGQAGTAASDPLIEKRRGLELQGQVGAGAAEPLMGQDQEPPPPYQPPK